MFPLLHLRSAGASFLKYLFNNFFSLLSRSLFHLTVCSHFPNSQIHQTSAWKQFIRIIFLLSHRYGSGEIPPLPSGPFLRWSLPAWLSPPLHRAWLLTLVSHMFNGFNSSPFQIVEATVDFSVTFNKVLQHDFMIWSVVPPCQTVTTIMTECRQTFRVPRNASLYLFHHLYKGVPQGSIPGRIRLAKRPRYDSVEDPIKPL